LRVGRGKRRRVKRRKMGKRWEFGKSVVDVGDNLSFKMKRSIVKMDD
jgi:hypothetical protein